MQAILIVLGSVVGRSRCVSSWYGRQDLQHSMPRRASNADVVSSDVHLQSESNEQESCGEGGFNA